MHQLSNLKCSPHIHDDCGQKPYHCSKEKNKEKRMANSNNVFHAACSNDTNKDDETNKDDDHHNCAESYGCKILSTVRSAFLNLQCTQNALHSHQEPKDREAHK